MRGEEDDESVISCSFRDYPVTVTSVGLSNLRALHVENDIRQALNTHFGDGKKRRKQNERELRKGNHRTSVFDSWSADSSVLSMIALYFAVYVRACAGSPSSWIAANGLDENEDDVVEMWMSEIADIAEGFAELSHMRPSSSCSSSGDFTEESVDESLLRVYTERMLKVLPHM